MSQHSVAVWCAARNVRKRASIEDHAVRSHREFQTTVQDHESFMSIVTTMCREPRALFSRQNGRLEQAVRVIVPGYPGGVVITTHLPLTVARSDEVRPGRSGQ